MSAIERLPITSQLAQTTIRLECPTAKGEIAVGTGFVFRTHNCEGQLVPAIITNRHVVEDADQIRFLLREHDIDKSEPNGCQIACTITDATNAWVSHPDADVDLAAIPLAGLLLDLRSKGKRVFWRSLDRELIPNADRLKSFSALEEITMIGYPSGLWDSQNNMPLFRRGITATHPNLNYEGRREFLIDAACFPGSSGSPVIRYVAPLPIKDGYGIRISGGGPQLNLLGVLYAGPQFTAEGEIEVVSVPTKAVPISLTQIPMNLGFVIKADRLLEFDSLLPSSNESLRLSKFESTPNDLHWNDG